MQFLKTVKEAIKPKIKRLRDEVNVLRRNYNPESYFAKKYFKQLRLKNEFYLSKQPHITVEISSVCNLNCLMCGTNNATRPKGFIDIEFFREVIEKIIIPNKQKYITANTIGETLLHPKLDEIFDILDKKNISLILVTNGLLFLRHAAILEKYSHVIANIQMSIDGAKKETYQKIRKGGNFEVLIENLEWLRQFNNKLKVKIPCEINAVLSEDNINELPDFFSIYSKYVGRENIYFWFLNERMAEVGDNDYFRTRRLLKDVKPVLRAPCLLPFVKSHILFNGDVAVCCRDYHGELIAGNLEEGGFQEIWEGREYNKIRQLLSRNDQHKLPLCRSCFELPREITVAVNMFLQYQLTIHGVLHKKIGVKLLEFLTYLNDIYVSANLGEDSFKKALIRYR